MKILIGFISGVVICSIFVFGARIVNPTLAETGNPEDLSDNGSLGLADLIPDIEKIYREALIYPFEKAESKIYDEDIAEYYSELLTKTGLRAEEPEAP
jgi:hypothetical protein